MKSEQSGKFWKRPLMLAVLVILLFLILVTAVSANSLNDPAWVTICHHPPGHPEQAQTMVVYWSILDTCLSYFGDTMGACPLWTGPQ